MPEPRVHQRKEIRQAAVTLLSAAITDVSGRVYPSRKIPLGKDVLPCILVYTNSEDVLRNDHVTDKRTLELSIEIHASGETETEVTEALDDLEAGVELAFQNNETLTGLVDMVKLTRSEEALSDEGKEIEGGRKLDYDVIYWTENVVDTSPDVTETIAANVGGLPSITELPQD